MSKEGCDMAHQRLHLPTCFRTLWCSCIVLMTSVRFLDFSGSFGRYLIDLGAFCGCQELLGWFEGSPGLPPGFSPSPRTGWMPGWVNGWLAGWLAGWLDGWLEGPWAL